MSLIDEILHLLRLLTHLRRANRVDQLVTFFVRCDALLDSTCLLEESRVIVEVLDQAAVLLSTLLLSCDRPVNLDDLLKGLYRFLCVAQLGTGLDVHVQNVDFDDLLFWLFEDLPSDGYGALGVKNDLLWVSLATLHLHLDLLLESLQELLALFTIGLEAELS